MNDWKKRIASLSESQRRLLARWVTASAPDSRSRPGPGTRPEVRKRLFAYVVAEKPTTKIDSLTLQAYMKDKLPDFMVPASITTLDSLPKMPNGKINFRALPNPCEPQAQNKSGVDTPSNDIERILIKIWSELLGVDLLGVHDNFFEFGGDSIISIQVISKARESGLSIEPRQLAEYPTVAGLASVVNFTEVEKPVVGGRTTGIVGLTPIQSWFLNRNLKAPGHWNQFRLLEVDVSISSSMLESALDFCVSHHDGLRANFYQQGNVWVQEIAKEKSSALEVWRLDYYDQQKLELEILRRQPGFDLKLGALFKFVLVEFGDGTQSRLLVSVHHLVIDHVSWSVLLEDLDALCQQQIDAQPMSLHSKSTSLKTWIDQLSDYANSDSCRNAISYWTDSSTDSYSRIPKDFSPTREPDEASADTVCVHLDESFSQSLVAELNDAYKTRTADLVLTALVQTLTDWMDGPSILIDMERHGREKIPGNADLARSIGWLTSFFPFPIERQNAIDPGTNIKLVKERLRTLPNGGLDFGLIRYLSNDDALVEKLTTRPAAEVLFNFMGTVPFGGNSLFTDLDFPQSSARAPENQRSHLLEINVAIINGRLTASWTYSRLVHLRASIENLANSFNKSLVKIIEHCKSPESAGFTPSDFPESGLSQKDLDQFLDELE